MAFWSAIPVVGKIVEGVISVVDQLVEDKDKANELKAQISTAALNLDYNVLQAEIQAQAAIIAAEAAGQSWLQRNWRPTLMMTFNVIIIFNYIVGPIFKLNLLPIPPDMWSLLQIGVGGYIVGRTVEKVAPQFVNKK